MRVTRVQIFAKVLRVKVVIFLPIVLLLQGFRFSKVLSLKV